MSAGRRTLVLGESTYLWYVTGGRLYVRKVVGSGSRQFLDVPARGQSELDVADLIRDEWKRISDA